MLDPKPWVQYPREVCVRPFLRLGTGSVSFPSPSRSGSLVHATQLYSLSGLAPSPVLVFGSVLVSIRFARILNLSGPFDLSSQYWFRIGTR